MQIFVINLERSIERREKMHRHLASLGLAAEFIPAIEGSRLAKGSIPPGTEPGLSPGEVGCYLSHVRSWQEIVDRRLSHAIVLEDDVSCSPSMIRVADEVASLGLPIDAVRLSALRPIRGILLTTLSGGENLILPTKNPSGAQGYMVTFGGAKRLLATLSVPRCPVDTALDAYWMYGLRIPLITPSVVEEEGHLVSTIAGRFDFQHSNPLVQHIARVAQSQRRKLTVFLMARQLRRRMGSPAGGNGAE
ncbi:MAG: glycosyltransferase family 25 protein [Zoogloea sp.]|uniref:glycosyltransferase family 25 protein n=1 Tax=Zoogloea sp. TaxID=49181 RepID=UPI0026395F55|nr:glycosyltransferase family 25 protein [Zoogloea sp.]MDD2988187.1 glycosyltransferase family 25 protein [Zoogloea sp.]